MAQNDIFHEKRHTRSFLQSFKWFQAILTSYHISHPDFPTNQIMDWDLDKGEILKTYKNEFDWLKTIFFHEKRHTRSFLPKFHVISSHFDKLPYFTLDFPTNQILDWDLDKAEILKTYKNEFDWLKTIFFHERRHTRSFLQSFKWF